MTGEIATLGAGSESGGPDRGRAALTGGEYTVRAITRKPDSEKAQALRAAGAEVVAGDLDDVESLVHALDGADAAFFVTNFWEVFSPEREKQQAKNLAEAAQRTGLKHVIWSTLEDTRKDVPLSDDRMPTLMGEYKVPHFDAKGAADA